MANPKIKICDFVRNTGSSLKAGEFCGYVRDFLMTHAAEVQVRRVEDTFSPSLSVKLGELEDVFTVIARLKPKGTISWDEFSVRLNTAADADEHIATFDYRARTSGRTISGNEVRLGHICQG